MKKSIIAFILFFTFMFSWPVIGLAEENTNISNDNSITIEQIQNNIVEKPQEPVIDNTATIEENNQKIDTYNEQVDLYNNYIAEENSKREEEYNETCANVDSHNESEQQKVEQNEKDLEKQEKRDERIASDTESKTAEYTTDVNNLPNSWEETNASPQTITVEQKESDESYKVMNLHIYVDENSGDTYYSTHIENNNNFYIDDNMKQNIILAEWECIQAGKNDIVTVYSQSKLYPNSGALFRRCLEGYTNGYWISTQEFTSTSKNIVDNWDENGPSTIVSYDAGTTDRQPIKNILNVFVYNFLRYGAEPEKVTKYIPDFWNYPDAIVYLKPLNKMDRLAESQPGPAPEREPEVVPEPEIIPEPKPDPEVIPEPKPKVDLESIPEIKTRVDPETIPEIKTRVNPETVPEIIIPSASRVLTFETPVTDRLILNVSTTTNTSENNTDQKNNKEENIKTIKENETPLARDNDKKEHWALINLVAMIVTILSAIKIPKRDENKEDDENGK